MRDCKHEWRAGLVWFGCTPGVRRQEFTCVRCGKSERRPFDQAAFVKGCEDMIQTLGLEIALRSEDAR